MNAKGSVFKYPDNVDTDVIIPARHLNTQDAKELASHCMEDIDKDFDQFLKMFTWNYLQKHFIKTDGISVSKEEALSEAKALAASQFAQYGMGNIPDELIEKYADEMLKKRENVEPLVEAAIDRKLAVALKEVVKLDTKEISLEDFNKMLEA